METDIFYWSIKWIQFIIPHENQLFGKLGDIPKGWEILIVIICDCQTPMNGAICGNPDVYKLGLCLLIWPSSF